MEVANKCLEAYLHFFFLWNDNSNRSSGYPWPNDGLNTAIMLQLKLPTLRQFMENQPRQ